MNTIETIESVIKRRRALVGYIESGCLAIEKTKERGFAIISAVQSNHALKLPADAAIPMMEKQVEELQFELAAIDKQLDAIGALMGAKA